MEKISCKQITNINLSIFLFLPSLGRFTPFRVQLLLYCLDVNPQHWKIKAVIVLTDYVTRNCVGFLLDIVVACWESMTLGAPKLGPILDLMQPYWHAALNYTCLFFLKRDLMFLRLYRRPHASVVRKSRTWLTVKILFMQNRGQGRTRWSQQCKIFANGACNRFVTYLRRQYSKTARKTRCMVSHYFSLWGSL